MMGGGKTKQEPSPFEYALADMAQKKYAFEKRNIRPLSDVLIRRTQAERSPARMDYAVGKGESDAIGALTPQIQSAQHTLNSTPGLSPASSAAQMRQGALGTLTATEAGKAGVDAGWNQDNTYIGGLQNITKIGTKQAALAQSGMSDAVKILAGQNSAQAGLNAQDAASTNSAVGTGVGVATPLAVAAIS